MDRSPFLKSRSRGELSWQDFLLPGELGLKMTGKNKGWDSSDTLTGLQWMRRLVTLMMQITPPMTQDPFFAIDSFQEMESREEVFKNAELVIDQLLKEEGFEKQTFELTITEDMIKTYHRIFASKNLHPLMRWLLQQRLSPEAIQNLYETAAKCRALNDLWKIAKMRRLPAVAKFNGEPMPYFIAIPPVAGASPGTYSLTIAASTHEQMPSSPAPSVAQ